jgi:hypothetical protein
MKRLIHLTQFVAALLVFALVSGCVKDQQFSNTPVIRFVSFNQLKDNAGKDSSGVLTLKFMDGDGDVGLSTSDTLPPFNRGSLYYFNLFINYFEKQNGTWVKVVTPPITPGGDTLNNNSRIPNLTPVGQDKTLEGELKMSLFTNNPFAQWDTIKYEVSICDRALNRSNQITTPEIILTK